MLSHLSSICSLALGLNLGYINLPAFSYHDKLERMARGVLLRLNADPEKHKDNKHYLAVAMLSKDHQFAVLEPDQIAMGQTVLDDEPWYATFTNKYDGGKDKKYAKIASFVAAIILILGVTELIGWFFIIGKIPEIGEPISKFLVDQNKLLITIPFLVSLAALATPFSNVTQGHRLLNEARNFFDRSMQEIPTYTMNTFSDLQKEEESKVDDLLPDLLAELNLSDDELKSLNPDLAAMVLGLAKNTDGKTKGGTSKKRVAASKKPPPAAKKTTPAKKKSAVAKKKSPTKKKPGQQ